MRAQRFSILIAALLAMLPAASAHGALELNEFDTYTLSDFEGQEESFVWEGFEIWDIYVGDGYLASNASHGVYFKGNFAGDGSIRPTTGQVWDLRFTFTVDTTDFERWIAHDGVDVTTNFEALEWQVADDNVFQVQAWTPVEEWAGQSITDLVVLSSVDGDPRDIAPGGIYDPVTGQEIPVTAPPSPAFPAMGEGRLLDAVPLTGAAKFLDVAVTPQGNSFEFTVSNKLAQQGQHFMFRVAPQEGWAIEGAPNAMSLDGGASTNFTMQLTPQAGASIEPLRMDFMTDIGGLQTLYAVADEDGAHVVNGDAVLATYSPEPAGEEAPGLPLLWLVGALVIARKRAGKRQ